MKAIHSAVKANLDTKTYTNTSVFNAYGGSNNISGGSTGNNLSGDGTTYTFAAPTITTNDGKVIAFLRVGEDNDYTTYAGSIIKFVYDIRSKGWYKEPGYAWDITTATFTDATAPYSNFAQHAYQFVQLPAKYRIYMGMIDRNNPSVQQETLFMIESTDGLIGRAWTQPVVIVPYYSGGQASFGGYLPTGVAGESMVILAGDTTATTTRGVRVSDSTGLRNGADIIIRSTAPFVIGEADFCRIDSNKVIAVVRSNSGPGDSLWMMTTTDNFATEGILTKMLNTSAGVIGAATGAKVTPRIQRCANNPNYLTVHFTDRGAGNRCYGTKASIANAFANSWEPIYSLGTQANQGNSAMIPVDVPNSIYLITTPLQQNNVSGIPSAHYTDILWWLFQDLYTKSISPAPYQ